MALLQLTRSGSVFTGSCADLESLKQEFDRAHCMRLPKLLDPAVLGLVRLRLQEAVFKERVHEGIGVELCMPSNDVVGFLHFLTNEAALLEIIQKITGCGPIGCFDGRVYRMVPGSGHYDSWHNDVAESRLIGMSINLSEEPYAGGVFQMREKASKRILCEMVNTGLADAILFRISPLLQHQVSGVEGSVPKTAFAGWFKSEPRYRLRAIAAASPVTA